MIEPSPLEMYESEIGHLGSACDDPWFMDQIGRYQAGEVAALYRISERCLRIVLALAKHRCGRFASDETVLEATQEGNAALVETIDQFKGTSAYEFQETMAHAVEQKIDAYLQNHG